MGGLRYAEGKIAGKSKPPAGAPKAASKMPTPEQTIERLSLMRAGVSRAQFANLLRGKDDLLFAVLNSYGWRGSYLYDEDYVREFDAVAAKVAKARADAIEEALAVANRPIEDEPTSQKAEAYKVSEKFRPGGFTNEEIPYGPDPATNRAKEEQDLRKRIQEEDSGRRDRLVRARKYLTRHHPTKWEMFEVLTNPIIGLTARDLALLKRNGLRPPGTFRKDYRAEVIAAIDRAEPPDYGALREYDDAESERVAAGNEVRNVASKVEGVAASGPVATLVGRPAGALIAWGMGKDPIEGSEWGAAVSGPFDASLPVVAGIVSRRRQSQVPDDYFESLPGPKVGEAPVKEKMPAPGGPIAPGLISSGTKGTPPSSAGTPPAPIPRISPPVQPPILDEIDTAFASLQRGELAAEHGAMLGDLMFHSQRRQAMAQLRALVDANLRTRPGRTPEGATINPNPGYQSAHSGPQSTLSDLPQYDPGDMITRFLPTGKGHVHTVFDQHWQAQFRAIVASGRTPMQTTAQEVYEVVSRAAMQSGAFPPDVGRSVSALVANDLFFQLGLSPNAPLRVPGT